MGYDPDCTCGSCHGRRVDSVYPGEGGIIRQPKPAYVPRHRKPNQPAEVNYCSIIRPEILTALIANT